MLTIVKRIVFLCVILLALTPDANATHNRAGEITYRHVEGLTYEVVITTYTKASALADRDMLFILWGDENGLDQDSIPRESENIIPGDIKVNIYRGTHTYGGPGVFELKVEDPNRNEGVLNMLGSVDTPFAIRSLLIIDPLAGHNNSVKLLNPATENACLNQEWIHNPAAFDEDGDLLTYSLVPCRGFNGEPIPTYIYPDEVSPLDDTFIIDSESGTVTWDSPQIVGEYNIAIRIEEWREVDGALIKVGEVVRDMQIDVQVCNNQPPEVAALADTCIVAGSFITWDIFASDPDGDNITLTCLGGPVTEVENLAIFTNLGGGNGEFAWSPTCAEVRLAPYQVVFKAKDQENAVPLTDIETVNIRVVAPAVENIQAEPEGNTVLLNWEGGTCSDELYSWQRENGFHDVYRKLESLDWDPTSCETGVPDGLGYELIASIPDLSNTTYVDNDLLSYGATYCYRVVMRFEDGGESLASDEACAEIIKDVPVMTNADVVQTDMEGEVFVGWSVPIDMDTLIFPLPYTYNIYRDEGLGMTEIASGVTDSTFNDSPVNTLDQTIYYKVEAISSLGDVVGESLAASTPWLSLEPNDNEVQLEVTTVVPWVNTEFYIERKTLGDADYLPYDTAFSSIYRDTLLVNTQEYCYRVTSKGHYDSPQIANPLLNRSQTACVTPFDFTPPGAPILEIDADCIEERDFMVWSRDSLSDDVMGYILYWAPTDTSALEPYAVFDFDSDTNYVFNASPDEGTIAGCFAVTALDSLLVGPDGDLRRNESEFSNVVCVDNCPFYFLPNIFTPNGDFSNDLFQPFPWKFLQSVEFVVHNRWGEEVFRTEDPNINWDGRHFESGEILPDGVYFYTATVYTIRLSGIVPEKFAGEFHLHGSRNSIID